MKYSLDTQSFLCAISCFVARRGKLLTVFSDNGTNLTHGCKKLKEEILWVNKKKTNANVLQDNIVWHFNQPHELQMNGVTERMIWSVHGVLFGLLKRALLKGKTLVALFAETEYIVNSKQWLPQASMLTILPSWRQTIYFCYNHIKAQMFAPTLTKTTSLMPFRKDAQRIVWVSLQISEKYKIQMSQLGQWPLAKVVKFSKAVTAICKHAAWMQSRVSWPALL